MQAPRTVAPAPQPSVFELAETMPVLVCRRGGAWAAGHLEAWRWDREGWFALVRYAEVCTGEPDMEWVPEYTVWCQEGKPAYPPDAAVSIAWSSRVG